MQSVTEHCVLGSLFVRPDQVEQKYKLHVYQDNFLTKLYRLGTKTKIEEMEKFSSFLVIVFIEHDVGNTVTCRMDKCRLFFILFLY